MRAPRAHVLTDDLDLTLTATRIGGRYTLALSAEHLDAAVPDGL